MEISYMPELPPHAAVAIVMSADEFALLAQFVQQGTLLYEGPMPDFVAKLIHMDLATL